MRFSTRLDSAVFQLTPTRTRCDLVIFANGKTEKIASGLLEPYLAHLRIAQDQMAKGGYSITLEPEHGSDATWFTKGTLERFIRFVNTPEVLERAFTLESEILQIEEAIAIQGKNDIGLSSVDDHHHQEKFVDGSEGRRPIDYNEEKAIVLYQQGAHPPEETGSAMQEGNSKIQLLKVLETRRTLLQKEQGMAFARAVAAGFDMDHMAPIICFAENFGASRLMDACMKFVELWKRKHETGQWLDIEAAGAMSVQSDISPIKAPGTIEFKEASNRTSEINGKASINMSTDQKPSLDHPPSLAQHEYFQGQFPHHMYAPWAVHPSPGTMPVFQPYPMQGMPYYPNYQGNSPYFQPPYQGTEDPRQNSSERIGRRHSMDNTMGDANNELGAWEKGVSQDDIDLDKGASPSRETGKRTSRSGRKQSGMVVIRNINYITSKGKESSGDESESTSGSGTEEEDGRALWSTKREGSHAKHDDTKEGDGGHWQAFQNHLLRDVDEGEHETNQNLFSMEKDVRSRKQDRAGDPLAFDERDLGEYEAANKIDMHNLSGKSSRVHRANEEPLISSKSGYSGSIGTTNADIGPHSAELDRRRGLYRNSTNDDFMLHKRATQQDNRGSPFDPNVKGFEPPMSSQNMDDDSYIVSLRSNSSDQVGSNDRNTRVMDSELPSAHQRAESSSSRIENRVSYEPDGLTLIPERRLQKGSSGYDPALDYEMHNVGGASLDKKNNAALVDSKRSSKKSDDNRKSKISADSLDKKKTLAPSTRVKPGKPSPLEEARARAERLRTFKADLQKIKKEKEDEQLKRLEALKIERQKRIAARSGSIPVQSPSQQKITQFPTKLSPSSHKGSKFSDSDPGPASPLQRFSVRTIAAKSNDSQTASKSNKLSRSASSLPEKKESSGVTPDTKSSMARTRRLSEPKMSTSRLQDSSVKPRGTRPSAKPRVSDGHESKNISSAKPRVSDGHESKNISSAKPRVSDGHESKNISSAKPRVSDGHESKNISSIVNHDKNMAASLPELKIKMARVPDNQGKSSTKELPQKLNDNKASAKWNFDNSSHTDRDDNPIIEKTVVMLEKPSNTVVQASQGQKGTMSYGRIDDTTEPELLSDYTAIRAPVSPLTTMDGDDNSHVGHEVQIRASDFEVRSANLTHAENKPSTCPVLGKPYQAPYAQVSALEDSFTGSSANGRELPTNVQLPITSNGSIKVNMSDSPTAKQETNKNESKGIRRLLKFGRKTHVSTGGQHNSESDNRGLSGLEANDIPANSSTSNEVHTLKNLLSQDDTPTSSTSQKTARHFSLLSPFRNKTSEKKLTT